MSKAKNMSKSVDQCNHLFSHFLFKTIKLYMYRTIILPVVLYGYKTWSLTLRQEQRLRVFKNGVLREIFGPKGVEVTIDGRPIASTIIVWLRIRTCGALLYTW